MQLQPTCCCNRRGRHDITAKATIAPRIHRVKHINVNVQFHHTIVRSCSTCIYSIIRFLSTELSYAVLLLARNCKLRGENLAT